MPLLPFNRVTHSTVPIFRPTPTYSDLLRPMNNDTQTQNAALVTLSHSNGGQSTTPDSPPTSPCPAAADTEPCSTPGSAPDNTNEVVSRVTGRRRTGKVACLPKAARDRLNQMIEDGVPYEEIIEALGDDGKHLTDGNISEWKKGGHQDWLKDEFWRQEMRARQESFTDLLAGAEPIKLPEAGLQVAATGICELLRDLCQAGEDGTTDSDKYVRVANSLARISRSILLLQQYRDTAAKQEARELKRLDITRKASDKERDILVNHWRGFFGHDLSQPGPGPASEIQGSRFEVQGSTVLPPPSAPISNPSLNLNPHPPVGPLPPAGTPSNPAAQPPPLSTINSQLSTSPPGNPQPSTRDVPIPGQRSQNSKTKTPKPLAEHCHNCRKPLPPLLATGERAGDHCKFCGTALRPPGAPVEFCPRCGLCMPELTNDGTRPVPKCDRCGKTLPTPAKTTKLNPLLH